MYKKMQAHGIYVHVPFCKRKCFYCDFFSQAGFDDALMLQYADAVVKQIEKNNFKTVPTATIYFGGGTPSVMPIEGIKKIVAALKKQGLWQNPLEATIECNPGTTDEKKLATYKELGFNRLSFGVQSFNDEELAAIGRIHNAKMALDTIEQAKKFGFQNINIDLIFGLPKQTLNSFQKTLGTFIQLDLPHLSLYSLILENNTPLQTMVQEKKVILPNENLVADMDDLAEKILYQNNYERYEISNFARKNKEAKHNLVYWNYLPYLGFGAGATGFDGYARYKGIEDIKIFIENQKLIKENLTQNNLYSEFMFMNLRKKTGVCLKNFEERYGENITEKTLQKLQNCIKNRLVEYDEENQILFLTKKGRNLSNLVFRELV